MGESNQVFAIVYLLCLVMLRTIISDLAVIASKGKVSFWVVADKRGRSTSKGIIFHALYLQGQ
jgi:hypothetical protein